MTRPAPRHPAWPAVRERWDLLLLISVGGALGSLARWSLTVLVPHRPAAFPWSVFLANVSGALLLGLLMAFLLDVWSTTRWIRPFLGVGVLGGYTTFSAYMLDARSLLVAGRPALALAYVAGTLIAGLAAVWLGIVTGRAVIAVATRRRGHELALDAPAGSAPSPPTPPAPTEPLDETRRGS